MIPFFKESQRAPLNPFGGPPLELNSDFGALEGDALGDEADDVRRLPYACDVLRHDAHRFGGYVAIRTRAPAPSAP